MIGGQDRIEPGLYKFVLAISEVDDTKPNTLLRTTYACTQRVNVPANVELVEARAHFGPDCGIEADIILR